MQQKDIEDIQVIFQSEYNGKSTLRPLAKYKDKTNMKANHYMVYSFAALPLLIEKMKQIVPDSWDMSHNHIQIRFAVDENQECWFALEGRPGDYIEYQKSYGNDQGAMEQAPAHSDMTPTSTAIGSGIIVFSPDFQITQITNFSGHYRPKPGTLVWIVDALVKLGADFTPEVKLAFYWKTGITLHSKQVSLPKEALHTLLPGASTAILTAVYRVAVCSKGEWTYFGPGETPQFKKTEETAIKRPRSSSDLSDEDTLSSLDTISDDEAESSASLVPVSLFSRPSNDSASPSSSPKKIARTDVAARAKQDKILEVAPSTPPLSERNHARSEARSIFQPINLLSKDEHQDEHYFRSYGPGSP